jgi:hypothetical protein
MDEQLIEACRGFSGNGEDLGGSWAGDPWLMVLQVNHHCQ